MSKQNIPEVQEKRRTFILDIAQNHGNNFVSAISPVVLCMNDSAFRSFLYYI